MAEIVILQGANMSFLGRRLPALYGTTTAAELDAILEADARRLGRSVTIHYTHVEGRAIELLYEASAAGMRGLLMNPAGFLYAGWALRDTLEALREATGLAYVEVHMTNIEARGRTSVLADQADGVIAGFGVESYRLGLAALVERLGEPA